MDKDLVGSPARSLSSRSSFSVDDSLLRSIQNILLADMGVEGNLHMGSNTPHSLSSRFDGLSVVEINGESTGTPCSSISRSNGQSIVENDEESTDSLKNSTTSASGHGNGSVQNLLKGIVADRQIGDMGSSSPDIAENHGESTNSQKISMGSISGQGNKGVVSDGRIGVVGSSGLGIIENHGESSNSLKNLISSVSGQGNGSVRHVPKGVIGDRRIRVVGSSRPGIVANDGGSTNFLKNPIGSVSSQGNSSMQNMPMDVTGDRRIGGMGSARIPMAETDIKRSMGGLMGYQGSGKCIEDIKTDFSFPSNSISLSAGHGNGSAQNLSHAIVSERSSQLETAGIDRQGIGSVSSSQIPAWKIEYLRLLESINKTHIQSQPDFWALDHNNGFNLMGSTLSLEHPTQGLTFCGDSHGISIGDYLNLITVPTQGIHCQVRNHNCDVVTASDHPNLSMGFSNEASHGENHQCSNFNGLGNPRLINHIPGNPTMVTAGLDNDLISTSAVIPDYISPIAENNLWGLYSSVIGQTPSIDGQNGCTMRAGCCSSSGIARNPSTEGNFEAFSDMLFQSHFGLAFSNLLSWERLRDDEIHSMARNITGCKHLLEILERGDLVATQKILGTTLGSMIELMAHESGNKLFRKLLDSCNVRQIFEIVLSVTTQDGALINAAKEKYGSSLSIQRLIRKVKRYSPLITRVTSALAPGIMSLMIHPFGFGVLQHCLIHLDDHQNTFIHEAAMEHCLTLGTHVKGCISLTEYLNHSKSMRKQLLLKKITELSLCLSQDPYGNYVVGAALELEIPEVICNICHQLKGHYVHLSTNKFSSFVVQKCLVRRTEFVLLELLESGKLGQLAFDPYGNYIVQTALEITKGVLKLRLINVLQPHSQNLQLHLHGQRIFHLLSGSVWK